MRDLYGGTGYKRPSSAPKMIATFVVLGLGVLLIYWVASWFGGEDLSNKKPDELFEMEQYKVALEKYQALGEDDPNNALMIAKCHIGLEQMSEAKTVLEKIVKNFAHDVEKDPVVIEALEKLAEIDTAGEMDWKTRIVLVYFNSPAAEKYAVEVGDYYYKKFVDVPMLTSKIKREWWKVREAYGLAELKAEGEERSKLRLRLDKVNRLLFFSPYIDEQYVNMGLMKLYKVDGYLSTIAKRENVAGVGLIARINNISNPDRVRGGREVKLLTGHSSVIVEKSKFLLTLYYEGKYLKEYKIGIGKDEVTNETPEGEFHVIGSKMDKNPEYTYKGKKYERGASDNPLGTRWIPISKESYGIHGNSDSATIGKRSSLGCIRMYNKDVEEVYDFLTNNDSVIIKP